MRYGPRIERFMVLPVFLLLFLYISPCLQSDPHTYLAWKQESATHTKTHKPQRYIDGMGTSPDIRTGGLCRIDVSQKKIQTTQHVRLLLACRLPKRYQYATRWKCQKHTPCVRAGPPPYNATAHVQHVYLYGSAPVLVFEYFVKQIMGRHNDDNGQN